MTLESPLQMFARLLRETAEEQKRRGPGVERAVRAFHARADVSGRVELDVKPKSGTLVIDHLHCSPRPRRIEAFDAKGAPVAVVAGQGGRQYQVGHGVVLFVVHVEPLSELRGGAFGWHYQGEA